MYHDNTTCTRRVGFVTSELYFWHDTLNWNGYYEPSMTMQPGEHYENAETKRRMLNLVQAVGLSDHLTTIRPRAASDDVINMVHPQSHIEHIANLCASGGGDAGGQTPVGPASLDIARLAVGGVIKAVDAVMAGELDNAYVLCRPPGHHALPDQAMGFCLFANAAIGIKHAQKQHDITRVAVVDWDVHHGNGTEAIFLDDPSVLTISLHQDRLFPLNSGGVDATGAEGKNLNIPLPAGSGSGAYREAIERVVVPALDTFKPELIVLPCGFDASAMDPLGVQMLSSEDFRWMTRQMLKAADRHCNGRVIVTHEGGYSATYVPYCGLAVLEEMSGASSTFHDPFTDEIMNYGGQDLQPHQKEALERAYQAHFLNGCGNVDSI